MVKHLQINLVASQLRHLQWMNGRNRDHDIRYESSRSMMMLFFLYLFPIGVAAAFSLGDPVNFVVGGIVAFVVSVYLAYLHYQSYESIRKDVEERVASDLSFVRMHGFMIGSSAGAIVFIISGLRIIKETMG